MSLLSKFVDRSSYLSGDGSHPGSMVTENQYEGWTPDEKALYQESIDKYWRNINRYKVKFVNHTGLFPNYENAMKCCSGKFLFDAEQARSAWDKGHITAFWHTISVHVTR